MADELKKYVTVGAGGAVAGGAASIFAFELFQKTGASQLLGSAQGTAGHVYAMTAFAMIACIVLATGYLVSPSEKFDTRAGLLISVTVVFLVVFVGGFIAINIRHTSVVARFVVDDYHGQFLSFHDGTSHDPALIPYVGYPELHISADENKGQREVDDQQIITVGIENLPEIEQKYNIYSGEDSTFHRDERDLAELCSAMPQSDSPACRDWRLPPTQGTGQ